jgi:pimeloyl-ACP methyl ester carboxylesterase
MIPAFTAQGTGPVILMLHGIGGGKEAFAPQLKSFAQAGYRAVAWDMPGYGDSATVEPYTFEALADQCANLIESLVPGDLVILLGHSMGGMVAQTLVARRPDLVSHLILCGTSAAFGHKPDGSISPAWQADFIAQRTAPLDAGQSMADIAAVLVPRMVGPNARVDGIEQARACMVSVNPSTYRCAIAALVTFDQTASLSAIAVPTLLIAGVCDKNASPSTMQAMAQTIPGSQYAAMPGIGHLQNLEAPGEFDALVLNFLATTANPSIKALTKAPRDHP